jgi:hypothetical protein
LKIRGEQAFGSVAGRQDAALYGRRDAYRYQPLSLTPRFYRGVSADRRKTRPFKLTPPFLIMHETRTLTTLILAFGALNLTLWHPRVCRYGWCDMIQCDRTDTMTFEHGETGFLANRDAFRAFAPWHSLLPIHAPLTQFVTLDFPF